MSLNANTESNEWLRSDQVRKLLRLTTCELSHLRQEGKIGFRKEGNAYLYSAKHCQRLKNDSDG